MPSPTELARAALEHSQDLRQEFELLKQQVDTKELLGLRDRFVILESRFASLEKYEAEIRRISVVEDRVADLKRHKDESDKRNWQFVFLAFGAACAVVGGVAVQMTTLLFKK